MKKSDEKREADSVQVDSSLEEDKEKCIYQFKFKLINNKRK